MKSTLVRVGRKLTRGLGVARLATVTVAFLWTTLALAVNPPIITLVGDNPLTVLQGAPYDPFDPGATAADPGEDGDLTDDIIVTTPPINTNIPGSYTVTYQVTDSEFFTVSVDRTVIVDAIPSITITGANPLTVLQDAPYDPNNPGATAGDLEDGNLTGSIAVDNPVDTAVPGDYTVTYSVTDSAGNNASATRTVTVNGAPTFTTIPIEVATEGVLYNYVAQTNDPDGDPRTVTPVTVPAWLTFTEQSNGRGRLRGTPSGADVGDNPVEIQVSDSVNPPVSQVFIIVVAAGGGVPTITILGDNPLTVLQGDPYDPANPGATANDPEDGDLSGSISIDNPVNTSTPGSYPVTYSVTDSAGNNASATRTVIVNGAPVFNSIPPLQATEAVEYLYNITASDGDGDPITITPLTVPGWLSFANTGPGTAELRGTPSGLNSGSHPVAIQVTDSLNAPASQSFTITVAAGAGVPQITLVGEASVTIQQGDPYVDAGATASDPEDGDLTDQIAVDNPVNNNSAGDYLVGYSVMDSAGNLATAERAVIVNGAPRFNSTPVTTANEDAPYNYTITASDPNAGDTITITASCTGPTNQACLQPNDWLTFQDNGNGTAVLSGTPAQADVGNWSIELQAEDQTGAVGTPPQTFTITVVNVNDAPVLDSPLLDQAAIEDTPFTFSVAGNFSDEDEDTLSFAAAGLPPSFTIDPVTGQISGTPGDADTLIAPVTAYTVVITASDTTASVMASFAINVENVNDLPELVGQATSLVTDEDVDIQITAASLTINDPDPGEVFLVALSAGANYTLIGDGTRVLPNPDYFGPLAVPASVSDSGGAQSNGIDLLITVNPVNDPPGGSAIDPQTATENVPFTLDTAPFFNDVEQDDLSFAATGLPPGLVIDNAGLISGAPTLDISVGDYAVQLTVSDGADNLVTGFDLSVLRAGRADLAVEVEATPPAAIINASTDWTITIRNNALPTPDVEAANVAVQLVFSGQVPFLLADPPNTACTATSPTQLDCTVGPVSGGGSVSLIVSGRGDQVGDVVVNAAVSISDPTPIDETPGNDSASGALSLSESVSAGAAQQLGGAAALSSVAADFDADGFVDLAVGTGPGETVMVHLNIVDPTDENKRILDEQGFSRGLVASTADIAAADLDGDGSMDLVTANGAGAASQVLLNDGAAGFQASPLGSSTQTSGGVTLGDVNGDMLIDIVFANSSPNPIFLNPGNGVFSVTPSQTLGNAASVDVILVDLLDDTLPEIVFANSDGDASIYRNNGGIFVFETNLPTGATSSVGAGDFDGDGLTDLVFGKLTSETSDPPANPVYRNTGSGVFIESATLGASPTSDVLCQDVNLDGWVDIVSLNTTGAHQIYVGDGAGGFAPNPQQFAASSIVRGSFGDVNADGRADLATSGANGNDLFLNDGLGNLGAGDITPPTITLVGAREVQLDVGDTFNDEGATATDNVDGDITAKILTDNPVDTAVVGTYTVTYDVIDNSGNAATALTRTVRVGAITGQGGGGGGSIGPAHLLLMILAGLLHLMIRQRIRRSMI